MPEVIEQNFEPTIKIVETWWAVNPGTPGAHPHSFGGGGEQFARKYIKKHPGYHLEIIRTWRTEVTQIVKVTDA